MHDDIYLWNNRIITQKEIDKYINKIGNKSDVLKKWIIFGVCCLLSGAAFFLISNSLKLKKSLETQTNQEIKIKSSNSPIKTVDYIKPNRIK